MSGTTVHYVYECGNDHSVVVIEPHGRNIEGCVCPVCIGLLADIQVNMMNLMLQRDKMVLKRRNNETVIVSRAV